MAPHGGARPLMNGFWTSSSAFRKNPSLSRTPVVIIKFARACANAGRVAYAGGSILAPSVIIATGFAGALNCLTLRALFGAANMSFRRCLSTVRYRTRFTPNMPMWRGVLITRAPIIQQIFDARTLASEAFFAMSRPYVIALRSPVGVKCGDWSANGGANGCLHQAFNIIATRSKT